ncbi:MAG TPA: thiamine pyrophosphate-requiring protein, partial [Myxococcaceae bacterium]|nr:thiamine pyrophosphate-requiring protein [Myxococcaceae bacterium]
MEAIPEDKSESTIADPSIAGDVFLQALARHGVEFFFANPGTDFPPIIEAFARAAETRAHVPRPILVPHENLAVAMAHGAYLVTGKPQAAMVHVNVGTGNAINLLTNASRDRVPLLLAAGRTPITERGAFGSRNRPIQWAQEMFDQAGMVRELVKWDYELRVPGQAEEVVARAFEVAMTEPRGPVYVVLPREPLSAVVEGPRPPSRPRAVPTSAYPEPGAIERLADWLAAAERPLLITSDLGRVPEDSALLGELAERFAIPVVLHTPRFLCLPTDHPLHHGFDPGPFLGDADLVVVLESDVPWFPSVHPSPASARVAHIGEDPAFLRYPMRSFPSDLSIVSSPGAALRALDAALEERLGKDTAIAARRRWAVERARSRRAKMRAHLDAESEHISPELLSQCIGEVVGTEALIFNEYQLRLDWCARTRPGTYFGLSPAGGLGWSVGAALGAKLAAPEHTVVAVIGDGGMIFGNPTACHWVAEANGLPILIVVFNNRRYGAVRNATLSMFSDGASGRAGGGGLDDLTPSPDFEL